MFFKLNKQNEEETKEQKLNEEDFIEIDGDKVELKDLIDAYKNSCKKNEDDKDDEKGNKCNADEEEEKENKKNADEEKTNEDSDDELVEKVTKIVEKILKERDNEDEDDEKANKISSYEKSNSLRQASKLYVADTFNYKTRAEKIAESNKKYSL